MLLDTDQLQRALGITANENQLALMTDIQDAIEARVAGVLNGRVIEQASYSRQFSGEGVQELLLPHYPIVGTPQVWIDQSFQFGSNTLLVAQQDFTWEPYYGILLRLTGDLFEEWHVHTYHPHWPVGTLNIKVGWTGGFETVPADLQRAAVVTAAEWWTRCIQLAGGQTQNEIASEYLGTERQNQYKSDMTEWGIPGAAMAIFKRYRNPN